MASIMEALVAKEPHIPITEHIILEATRNERYHREMLELLLSYSTETPT